MKVNVKNIGLQFDLHRKPQYLITSDVLNTQIHKLKQSIEKGKEVIMEIKEQRKKRSLDANAYLWLLLDKMAQYLENTKEEVYLMMLERYGVFTHVIVKPEAVDRVKEEWRTVKDLGEVTVNGKTGVQLQCYFGSSTYDTKEMSRLIDGVVSECKEMDIETLPPDKLSLIKNEWDINKAV